MENGIDLLRENLRRWGELFERANRAAVQVEKLKCDLRTAPDKAESLVKVYDEDLRTVEEYSALISAIRQQAPVAARVAEQAGIDAGPLLLFAEKPEVHLLEAARSVAARVIARISDAGSDPHANEQVPTTHRSRGRKPHYSPAKDEPVAKAWERARDSGVRKKDFAKDEGLSLKAFNQLLNRVRKRNN